MYVSLHPFQYIWLQPTLRARLLPHSTVGESNKEQLIASKDSEKVNHDRSAHDLPIGCTVTYFDHVSNVWVVGRVAEHTHKNAYLIQTEAGRLVSHNTCDICQSQLSFVPLPEPNLKPQSVQAQKSNSRLAPGLAKPCVKQLSVVLSPVPCNS